MAQVQEEDSSSDVEVVIVKKRRKCGRCGETGHIASNLRFHPDYVPKKRTKRRKNPPPPPPLPVPIPAQPAPTICDICDGPVHLPGGPPCPILAYIELTSQPPTVPMCGDCGISHTGLCRLKRTMVGECPICMEDIYSDNSQATTCGHVFHSGCLGVWFGQKRTCPLCQTAQ